MLEAAYNHLSQDLQTSLVELKVMQSQLWSMEQVQWEVRLKLEAVVKHLEGFKDGE